jgi:hypothetical protein
MAPASWRPVSAPRPWRRPVRGACLDLAKRESRTRTGRPAGRNGGAHCPPTRWLGRSRPGRWLDRHGDGRFDPASWGQDAPPSPPRPGSATPATPIARSERKRSDACCSWPRGGRSEARASISRSENLGPVPAAQRDGTVERVAPQRAGLVAAGLVAGSIATAMADSIQRLGGKPRHLRPTPDRGRRPQLHSANGLGDGGYTLARSFAYSAASLGIGRPAACARRRGSPQIGSISSSRPAR